MTSTPLVGKMMLQLCITLRKLVSVRLTTFSELFQTSKMESITKIDYIWKPFIIFAKSSILDAWRGLKYTFGTLSCLRILTGKKHLQVPYRVKKTGEKWPIFWWWPIFFPTNNFTRLKLFSTKNFYQLFFFLNKNQITEILKKLSDLLYHNLIEWRWVGKGS